MKTTTQVSLPPLEAKATYACRLASLGFVLALVALFALTIDIPVADFCLRGRLLQEFQKLLMLAEAFAHGAGVAIILLTVYTLDPENRGKLPRLVACAYLPGFINTMVKLSLGRQRPSHFGFEHLPQNGWDTFVGLFPAATSGDWQLLTDRSIQSFASGHTTAAVGLAIGLIWLYPRGRWLFISLACLAAMQRLAVGAHFASDVLAGAAISCFAGRLLMDNDLLGRGFERIERSAVTPKRQHRRPRTMDQSTSVAPETIDA